MPPAGGAALQPESHGRAALAQHGSKLGPASIVPVDDTARRGGVPASDRAGELLLTSISCPQELRSQKQKIVSERERLQAELDHLRKCLALPAMHWPRGYFKGYPR